MRETWTGLGLLFRLSALTLGATFGSLGVGIALDHALGSAPFGTLCLMILGIWLGTLAVYRSVKEANERIIQSRTKEENES
ncbi:MAG: AtpZ/AtpI family protein [Anaerolineae bacterium]|nr:AtpZ/AtpI family protein [Anaerolineae bacterium]